MDNILKNFKKNGFIANYFESSAQAVDYLKKEINNSVVTFGGSMTCVELNLHDIMRENNKVFYHGDDGVLNQTPDVYIASANALTTDGRIINIDGRGNRVSATIFGPKKVYLICGTNKLEDSLEKAMFRAKQISAPLNSRRLKRKTPCVSSELRCYNCNSPERICMSTVIMDKKSGGISHFEIILINEKLGY